MTHDPAAEPLEDRLCVMLYRASHAMTSAYRQLLEPLDLTYPQYTVLSVLWQQDVATVKELGAVLDSDYSTVSPMIKRLEDKGLVHRRRSSTDEREVDVHLTAHGQDLRSRASSIQDDIAHATGLDYTSRKQLVDDLGKLAARLKTFAQ